MNICFQAICHSFCASSFYFLPVCPGLLPLSSLPSPDHCIINTLHFVSFFLPGTDVCPAVSFHKFFKKSVKFCWSPSLIVPNNSLYLNTHYPLGHPSCQPFDKRVTGEPNVFSGCVFNTNPAIISMPYLK